MNDSRLALAEWLVEAGAGASARTALGDARGGRANRLRLRSRGVRLAPGFYALVASEGGGLVLPLTVHPGRSTAPDPRLRDACDLASEVARRTLDVPELPSLHVPFEQWLAASGPSIGLPALLAFLAHFAPHRRPAVPVLATGRIDLDGRVQPVGHMPEKLAAAAAEVGERLVLIPGAAEAEGARADLGPVAVRDVPTATARVFGPAPLAADPALCRLDRVIERSRQLPDPAEALERLRAFEGAALPPADRVRLQWEIGTRLRHLGRGAEAERHHATARAMLADTRGTLGAEAAERYELEHLSTMLSRHAVDQVVAALRERLEAPFLTAANELRARGLLAFALGVAGRNAEAVAARRENLPLHDASAALDATRAFTLCYLTLDSALAGDGAGFESFGRDLVAATAPGDARQWRYDAMVLVRGAVALGRRDEALAWAEGEGPLLGAPTPPDLLRLRREDGPVRAHPEVSTLRGLVRALRLRGDPVGARALASRAVPGEGLLGWVSALAGLEAALACLDAGEEALAARLVEASRAELRRCDPTACAFHRGILEAGPDALGEALGRVWY